jgi:hypothetical protein
MKELAVMLAAFGASAAEPRFEIVIRCHRSRLSRKDGPTMTLAGNREKRCRSKAREYAISREIGTVPWLTVSVVA